MVNWQNLSPEQLRKAGKRYPYGGYLRTRIAYCANVLRKTDELNDSVRVSAQFQNLLSLLERTATDAKIADDDLEMFVKNLERLTSTLRSKGVPSYRKVFACRHFADKPFQREIYSERWQGSRMQVMEKQVYLIMETGDKRRCYVLSNK